MDKQGFIKIKNLCIYIFHFVPQLFLYTIFIQHNPFCGDLVHVTLSVTVCKVRTGRKI